MSCTTCGTTGSCGCNPCNQALNEESLASQINNLTESLLGTFTKTISNGRATWSAECSPNTNGVACFPKSESEGFICYILRVLEQLGIWSATIHDSALTYCKNSMVASGVSLYISKQAVPAGIAISNTTYWLLLITAPDGPQGPPGASGGGSATNYATQTATVDTVLTNTSAVVFCKPAAGAINITIPAIGTVDPGKWFKIHTNGAFNVTLVRSGGNTLNGAAANITLATVNEAVELIADDAGTDWKIF